MRRILRVSTLVVLALLCVSSAGLGPRSRGRFDRLSYSKMATLAADDPDPRKVLETHLALDSLAGDLYVHYSHSAERAEGRSFVFQRQPSPNGWSFASRPLISGRMEASYRVFDVLGFQVGWLTRDAPRSRALVRSMRLPYWMPFAISAVPLAIVSSRRLRRRAWVPGTCANCGYDLRATPDRCPECGASAAVDRVEPV